MENPENCSAQVGFGSMTTNSKCKSCYMVPTQSKMEIKQGRCWGIHSRNHHKIWPALHQMPRKREAERLCSLVPVPHVYFLPRDAAVFQHCTGKGLEILCSSFASLVFMKKKKTEDLCGWVNFHLKLSSAVRQNSRILLKQRCACCHTSLCAFLDAHRCRYWGYRRFIRDPSLIHVAGHWAQQPLKTNKPTKKSQTPHLSFQQQTRFSQLPFTSLNQTL